MVDGSPMARGPGPMDDVAGPSSESVVMAGGLGIGFVCAVVVAVGVVYGSDRSAGVADVAADVIGGAVAATPVSTGNAATGGAGASGGIEPAGLVGAAGPVHESTGAPDAQPRAPPLEPPLCGVFASRKLAEKAMRDFAREKKACMKKAPGKKTLSSRHFNELPKKKCRAELTLLTSLEFIDPSVEPIWRESFYCQFHSRSSKKKKAVDGGTSRPRRDDDMGCRFRALVTTVASRESLTDTPRYEYQLRVSYHPDPTNRHLFVNGDPNWPAINGHSHGVDGKEETLRFLAPNKALRSDQKDYVREVKRLNAKPLDILRVLKARLAESGDTSGQFLSTKTIGNFIQSLSRKQKAGLPIGATEVDEMLAAVIAHGCKFDLYLGDAGKSDAGSGVGVPDLDESDFEDSSDGLRRERAAGKEFTSMHWAFPGAEVLGEAHGDIVGLDSTHDMNAGRLFLYFSVVRDSEGNSHIVTCSLFASENSDAIAAALRFQKQAGCLSHKTVIIDKDNVEMAALRREAPDAYILLCRFHTIKYFVQRMAVMYLPLQKRDAACGLWRRMVYSENLEDFNVALETLREFVKDVPAICSIRDPLTPPTLIEAIEKNWLPCYGSWSLVIQQWHLTTELLTNNSSESVHRAVKHGGAGLNLRTRLPDLVQQLHEHSTQGWNKLFEKTGTRMIGDEEPVVQGQYTLAKAESLSGWMCDYARAHFLRAHKHAASRTYEVDSAHLAPAVAPRRPILTIGLQGQSPTSQPVTVTLCLDPEGLPPAPVIGAIDPRRVAAAVCTCAEYATFGNALCRHCLWVLTLVTDAESVPTGRLPLTIRLIPERDQARFNFKLAQAALAASEGAKRTSSVSPILTGIKPLLHLSAYPPGQAHIGKFMPEAKEAAQILADLVHPERPGNDDVETQDARRRAARWTTELCHRLSTSIAKTRRVPSEAEVRNMAETCDANAWNVHPHPESMFGDEGVLQVFLPQLKSFARSVASVAVTKNRSANDGALGQTAAAWASTLVSAVCADIRRGELPTEKSPDYLVNTSKATLKAVKVSVPGKMAITLRKGKRAVDTRKIEKRRKAKDKVQAQVAAAAAVVAERAVAARAVATGAGSGERSTPKLDSPPTSSPPAPPPV